MVQNGMSLLTHVLILNIFYKGDQESYQSNDPQSIEYLICVLFSVVMVTINYLKRKGTSTGPCLATAIWRCRKNSSQWQCRFQRKLHSHWLKFLRQRHVAVVRQGPGNSKDIGTSIGNPESISHDNRAYNTISMASCKTAVSSVRYRC